MDIQTFWRLFSQSKKRLRECSTAEAVETIFNLISHIDRRLAVEVGETNQIREIIFSANGLTELFPLVTKLVENAPTTSDFQFVSLKPPRGFAFKFRHEGGEVDPSQWHFFPFRDNEGKLMIQLCTQGTQELDLFEIELALETGVGERVFSEIDLVTLAPNSALSPNVQWLPIEYLVHFLERVAIRS